MIRADQLLVQQGLARSRTQAQRWIDHGCVQYRLDEAQAWQAVSKCGLKLPEVTEFHIEQQDEDRFVSRGGLKLFNALQALACEVSGHWLDIGQSTGGFTDCLLQQGAAFVTGVDVGHDQLVPELKNDPRVFCYEGINARDLPPVPALGLKENNLFDALCMDVSFISQSLVVPGLVPLLKPNSPVVALVKPQFELQPEQIGKGGIVTDLSWYAEVEQKIRQVYEESGFEVLDYMASSIKGGDGNREFFIYARKKA